MSGEGRAFAGRVVCGIGGERKVGVHRPDPKVLAGVFTQHCRNFKLTSWPPTSKAEGGGGGGMATEQRVSSSLFRAHVPYYTACHGTNNRNEFVFLLHGGLVDVF